MGNPPRPSCGDPEVWRAGGLEKRGGRESRAGWRTGMGNERDAGPRWMGHGLRGRSLEGAGRRRAAPGVREQRDPRRRQMGRREEQ